MDTVRQLLETKGTEIWHVSPDTSVFDAIAMMADKGCGALLVMDGERLAGIISERDYARKVILAGLSSKGARVSEVMTTDVVTATPSQSVERCLNMMTERRIRHLPIIDAGKVLGVVSIGDLVKAIVVQQRYLIRQLEQYIKQ